MLRVGESLTGRVVRDGHAPLAVAEMRDDPRLAVRERVERYGYRSFLGVPLRRGGEMLGTPGGGHQGAAARSRARSRT